MLACINCARPVVFAVSGWVHRDPDNGCSMLNVAWPPPGAAQDDEDDGDAAAERRAAS
jgi:hypothetical protein